VQHFADPRVGAVSGELHLGEADGAGRGVDLYWKYEKLIRRTESQIDSTVGVTGALYALRKELFRPLDPRIILDDVAIPMDVVQAGLRVLFEPGARVFDRASNASDTEYRRKLRTLAGNYQLVFLEPWLLDPRRNRLWWQFVSHKLTRLAVPWCLLAAFGASLALAESGWFYQHLFLLQAAFYLLAVAGWLLDSYHAAPRWLAFPYAFLLLNLAAASSLFGFLLGTQKAAWKEVAP